MQIALRANAKRKEVYLQLRNAIEEAQCAVSEAIEETNKMSGDKLEQLMQHGKEGKERELEAELSRLHVTVAASRAAEKAAQDTVTELQSALKSAEGDRLEAENKDRARERRVVQLQEELRKGVQRAEKLTKSLKISRKKTDERIARVAQLEKEKESLAST